MRRAAIVVPCFNEERRLDADAYVRFVEAYPPGAPLEVAIVFVDDGSTDGTARVLQAIAARAPRSFRVLTQRPNQGKAEAVRKGILDVLSRASGRDALDAVGFWDADLATPLTELPAFVEVLEKNPGIDVVLGSRVKLMGRTIDRRPWRHYMGRIFATAASMALELPIYDTQCGAKLFRVTDWTARLFAEPFVAKWVFDVELIARILRVHPGPPRTGARSIYELPVSTWADVGGSKLKSTDFAAAALDLAKIRLRYPRRS
ncbi:MAG TPA: glycosyltransferase [Polyangiaceae bacterium]|jgi:glycosyltransferase involved in cell wall biosynthesis|nr:glycosyltransferase [Polyangiaceae bacterium]